MGNKMIVTMMYTAVMTALVFIATYVIRIPVPATSGYINLGDGMVLLSGILLGPIYGAFAGGVGSALSDMISGYAFWILPTLIIKGFMAFVVGKLIYTSKLNGKKIGFFSIGWLIFSGVLYSLNRLSLTVRSLFEATLAGLQKESGTPITESMVIEQINKLSPVLIVLMISVPLLLILLFLLHKRYLQQRLSFNHVFAYFLGSVIMVTGYYLTYGIIAGNFMVPIFSVPANVIQGIGGFIIATLLTPYFQRIRQTNLS